MKKIMMVGFFCVILIMGVNLKSRQVSEPEPGNIMEACREVSVHYVEKKAHYASIYNELVWHDIKESYERDAICDPTYVAEVLYKSNFLSEDYINAFNYNWCGEGGVPDMLRAAGWEKVTPKEIKPGDIIVKYSIYSCIYAGNNSCWDYTSCIFGDKSAGKPHTNCFDLDQCLIFRAPNP